MIDIRDETVLFQQGRYPASNRLLIVDHEDLAATTIDLGRRGGQVDFHHRHFRRGEHQRDRSALLRAVQRHVPAVLMHDPVNNRKPEAGSATRLLRREERVENLLP